MQPWIVWRSPPARNRIALSALGACCLLAPSRAVGQEIPIPTGINEAQIREAAEKEGAAFSTTKANSDQAQPRVCVSGYDFGPAQSGEFTIGGNLGGGRAMLAGRQGKVWWAPLVASRDMPPLLVRGRSLTNPTDTVRFTSSTVASPGNPGAPPTPEAQRKYFFPSGITIPQPGRWLVIATSGTNWGCFILTVVGLQ